MFSPCECCTYKTEHREGHRIITGCKDEEKAKGFHQNELTYRHTCDNHTPHEKCLTCKKYQRPYCNNNYVNCEYVPIEQEVKHGSWIPHTRELHCRRTSHSVYQVAEPIEWYCSECKSITEERKPNCPNCNAKMDR